MRARTDEGHGATCPRDVSPHPQRAAAQELRHIDAPSATGLGRAWTSAGPEGAPRSPARGSALVAAPLAGPLEAYARLRWLRVDLVAAGPLLAAQRPLGAGGGDVALAETGLLLDTRDLEVDTHRGFYVNASVFGSPALGGSARARVRGRERDVQAIRAARAWRAAGGAPHGDVKRGSVPFFELGGFAGACLLWDQAVLLRVELGYAGQGSAAVYVSFGEEF